MKTDGRDLWRVVFDGVYPAPTGCWEWMFSRTGCGYGQFTNGGRYWLAHRASYEAFIGPIPAGKCVCHRCDNPGCVNPGHLFVATHAENMADKARKGRSRSGGRPSRGLVSEGVVAEIRELRNRAGWKLREIASRFSISESHVQKIASGKSWKHI